MTGDSYIAHQDPNQAELITIVLVLAALLTMAFIWSMLRDVNYNMAGIAANIVDARDLDAVVGPAFVQPLTFNSIYNSPRFANLKMIMDFLSDKLFVVIKKIGDDQRTLLAKNDQQASSMHTRFDNLFDKVESVERKSTQMSDVLKSSEFSAFRNSYKSPEPHTVTRDIPIEKLIDEIKSMRASKEGFAYDNQQSLQELSSKIDSVLSSIHVVEERVNDSMKELIKETSYFYKNILSHTSYEAPISTETSRSIIGKMIEREQNSKSTPDYDVMGTFLDF